MCNDLEKLNLVIDEVDIRYNYLIISAHIFNLLEQNKEFFVYNMDSKFSNGLIKVGVYKSFDVYLDLLMPPNELVSTNSFLLLFKFVKLDNFSFSNFFFLNWFSKIV